MAREADAGRDGWGGLADAGVVDVEFIPGEGGTMKKRQTLAKKRLTFRTLESSHEASLPWRPPHFLVPREKRPLPACLGCPPRLASPFCPVRRRGG